MRIDIGFDLNRVSRYKGAENHAAKIQDEEGAKNRYGRAEQDTEGQRPAFVQRGKNEKDEEQRKSEDDRRRNTFAGFLLLERNTGVVETHFARHGLRENRFERSGSLVGAKAGRGAAVDLGAAIFIEAHGEFRTKPRLDGCERGERDVLAFIIADIKLSDVFRASAVLALSLDINLPLAAEAIEIVNEVSAHEGLDGAVDIVEVHALLQDLVAVDVNKFLRDAGQERCAKAGDFRALASGVEKSGEVPGEEWNVGAGTVFKDEGEAAGSADAGNGRRGESESNSLGQFAQLAVEVRLDRLKLFSRLSALIPGLQGDGKERVVAGADKTQQTEADDAGGVSNAGSIGNDFFNVGSDGGGAFE